MIVFSRFHGNQTHRTVFGSHVYCETSAGPAERNINMPDSEPKAKLRQQIDQNLKRVYQEALEEDVPDRFKDLLLKLRDKDKLREAKS